MSPIRELAETVVGAVALTFGAVVGATVYLTGSLASVPGAVDRLLAALALAALPPLSAAAWPNLVALAVGAAAAIRLDDRLGVRLAALVAAYVSLAIALHYAAGPA
ncbi:hypothetical protein [Salinilacihabitans rarus]|uniref:hypothetical protein n=1 Tax=Salinilacihabitans rarus TaxID=2961596 RepID=UPI0020C9002B|nr:hypothetical protein [Salinilacihabitans rarus]